MSGSSSKTATSSSQSTNVSELNLQDTGGITIADNTGSTKLTYVDQSTDYGAIGTAMKAITDAVSKAFSANTNVTNSAINLANDASANATSAAVTLGTDSLSVGGQVANHGLDNAAAAYESGLTFGSNALNVVANLISDQELRNQALTSAALGGYQSIAQQNSQSNSSQLKDVALYALLAAVALVVLPKVFR